MAKKRKQPASSSLETAPIRDRIRELRRVPASELIANDLNWRVHPQSQQNALRAVLTEVGYSAALIAREREDGSLVLIDGHLRKDTTPDTVVPVLILDVSEAEANKLLATLDPLAALAGADKDKLDALLREVQTGDESLGKILTDLATANGVIPGEGGQPAPGEGGDEFDTEAALEGECRVQPGDLWLIDGGKHRLACGDSTEAATVERLMGGEKASLCFTSPPYAQQRDYGKKINDWDALMQGVFANLPMTDDGQVLVNLGLVHRDGEWIPYWEGWIEWMRAQGWRRFGWYVWDQGSGLPGDWSGRLAPSHEFVFHFNRESVKPEKIVRKQAESIRDRTGDTTMRGDLSAGRPMSSGGASLQTHKIADSVLRIQRQCGSVMLNEHHPAVFPVALPEFAINCWPGDVYDPFGGSGTTLIAAHRLGRKSYLMELEPKYCEIILRRAEAESLSVEKASA
jgi:DNA modification methylase